jgi:hypothetical protein
MVRCGGLLVQIADLAVNLSLLRIGPAARTEQADHTRQRSAPLH